MTDDAARERLLDAAEGLFYARGIQAVGMDAVREGSGLPLQAALRPLPGEGGAGGSGARSAATCAGAAG